MDTFESQRAIHATAIEKTASTFRSLMLSSITTNAASHHARDLIAFMNAQSTHHFYLGMVIRLLM
jgi:hypothetical protein